MRRLKRSAQPITFSTDLLAIADITRRARATLGRAVSDSNQNPSGSTGSYRRSTRHDGSRVTSAAFRSSRIAKTLG
jgi:argininosuccinate lyase